MSKLTAEMSTGQHMRKVREYSFHGSVQFCPLSPIVQFHHFQISMGHVASEILALPPFRQSVTRIWRQTPPEGFCHMSSFQILHYKSYPEKDFVEERLFSSLMGPSLTTQVMVAQKASKQDHFANEPVVARASPHQSWSWLQRIQKERLLEISDDKH